MAFHGVKRREIKKQSYYVWFLGAKESKGLRGEQYIRPILNELLEEEKQLEPAKVTLQVSSKGLKIIENVPRQDNRGKTEHIKHFIPHHAITCVIQESKPNDDIVCAILLVYNPLTKCPVHVHCYRCDSVETGTTLRNQLKTLTDRPENQKKLREIETRLEAKGFLPYRRLNSDGRSIRTEGSDPTDDSLYSDRDIPGKNKENINSLYDSLAAELREKLNNQNSCPILLPPKDYDPISRKQGKLQGIEERRSTNFQIVGVNQRLKSFSVTRDETRDSSGNSSGIGSDEALSSAIQEIASHLEYEKKRIDPDINSDDEDWQDSLAQGEDLILPQWRQSVPPVHRNYGQRSPNPVPKRPQPILPNHLERNVVSGSSRDDWYSRFEKYTGSQDAFKSDRVGCSSQREEEEALTDSLNKTRPFSYHIPKKEDISLGLKKSDLDSRVVYRQKSPGPPPPGQMNLRPVSFPSTKTVNRNRLLSTSFNSYPSHSDYPRELRPVERQRSNPVPGGLNRNSEFLPRRYFSTRPRTEANHAPFYEEHGQQLSPVCHVSQTYRRDENLHTDKHPFVPLGKPISAKTPGDIVSKCQVGRHMENFRQLQYSPEERHKSGSFELPVNPREYRHSIAEPLNRRLPLNFH
ncbi:uncharacterized protein LOC106464020 [Limulus polyphemus]|uniref:Uncharacterized protein LOC106464020 n=1 Tax=Limulus polyphemus TaxID=6850 RepID=A0ABM1BD57_LIMPO|nr:uncharacterized protein LOC106464020 [Limulus polyphemus]